MGLDMFLTAKRHLWSNSNEQADAIKAMFPEFAHVEHVNAVVFEAAYWRKANAVHLWFVNNVQKGVDDCGTYYVTKNQLRSLVALCGVVVADLSQASALLPPIAGFFFGSTAVDEWYVRDLKDTISMLTPYLDDLAYKYCDFEYHSSW